MLLVAASSRLFAQNSIGDVVDAYDPNVSTNNFVYKSPEVVLEGGQVIIDSLNARINRLAEPVFVIISYTQDTDDEAVKERYIDKAPEGLGDYKYLYVVVANIPGSVKLNAYYKTIAEVTFTAESPPNLEEQLMGIEFEGDERVLEAGTDPEILKNSFRELINNMICSFKNGTSTERWVWPQERGALFVPGKMKMFDGKEYFFYLVKKGVKRFREGKFSSQPIETIIGTRVELRFYSDEGDNIIIVLDEKDKESFLRLINGEEFQQNFDTWITALNNETEPSLKKEMVVNAPKCALENYSDIPDRVSLIKVVLDDIPYFDEYEEGVILRLINDIDIAQVPAFHDALIVNQYKNKSLFNQIVNEFNDKEWFFSDGNSGKLIDVFTAQALNSKLTNNSVESLKTDLKDNELLYIWSGIITHSQGDVYNLYSSSINDNGQLLITVGEWHSNNWNANREVTYTYDPLNDWVVIYSLKNIDHIGYLAGETYIVPAIVLHYLINEENNEQIKSAVFTSLDIAAFAIGAGVISSGVRGWKLAVAVIETVSAATAISLEVFEDDLKENGWTDEEINNLRMATAIMELVGVGVIEGPKLFRRIQDFGPRLANKLDGLGTYASKLKPAVRERLQKLKEFLLKYGVSKTGSFTSRLDNILNNSTFNELFSELQRLNNTTRRARQYATPQSFRDEFIQLFNSVEQTAIKNLDNLLDDFDYFLTQSTNVAKQENVVKFLDELMESSAKFKAAATSLEVIKNPSRYINNVDELEDLEDLISSTPKIDGEFRFDIKFKTRSSTVSVFVDTKNYSSASQIFSNLSQVNAYFKKIVSFDEFRIVQQSRTGITLGNMQRAFKNALLKDVDDVFIQNPTLFQGLNRVGGIGKVRNSNDLELLIRSKKDFLSSELVSIIKVTQ